MKTTYYMDLMNTKTIALNVALSALKMSDLKLLKTSYIIDLYNMYVNVMEQIKDDFQDEFQDGAISYFEFQQLNLSYKSYCEYMFTVETNLKDAIMGETYGK